MTGNKRLIDETSIEERQQRRKQTRSLPEEIEAGGTVRTSVRPSVRLNHPQKVFLRFCQLILLITRSHLQSIDGRQR